ncbi:protein FAR1-RELATED SEQUENCE 9-like [Lotus japonicus]|uniref:protein FAR1-RELATED SEQUENCE 9-like n=1 Tax=Lotus japonicus TaxID=34305 RepID=UPI0025861AF3|nr:protein FAR1-RELATED SEQUENCE 9-like [Lotus japonicus]
MRFKEVGLDFKSAYGEATLETPLRSLERSASQVFTLDIYLLIKPVLARAGAVRVISCNETFTCDIYTVSNCGVAQKQWHVSHYEPTSLFSCSCLRMESFGLPCTHLIAVLVHLNILEFLKCLILRRWTKAAKQFIRTEDNHDGHDNFFWESQKACQYASLVDHCQNMSKMSLVTDVDFEETKNMVIKRIMDLKAKHYNVCTQNEHASNPNATTHNGNPVLLNPASRVRDADVHPNGTRVRRVQKCSHCKTSGHNIVSCPELRNIARSQDI